MNSSSKNYFMCLIFISGLFFVDDGVMKVMISA